MSDNLGGVLSSITEERDTKSCWSLLSDDNYPDADIRCQISEKRC